MTAQRNTSVKRSPGDLVKGSIYSGKIDRISHQGNGIIEMVGGLVNLGEISHSKIDESVAFRFTGGDNGSIVEKDPSSVESISKAKAKKNSTMQPGSKKRHTGRKRTAPSIRKVKSRSSNKHNLLNNYNNDA